MVRSTLSGPDPRPDRQTSSPLDLVGVVKAYGQVTALEGVDLRVEEGEVHGLLGRNGAGKSTLLRIVFGLVRPDAGEITLLGRGQMFPRPAEALAGVSGFVDRPRFYPYLSARRNLELLALMDGVHGSGPGEALERVGLATAGNRRVSGWSTGMLQRLGIAAALLRAPQLLVLDEPTEGLDPAAAADLVTTVGSLAGDGVTVVFSSHDLVEVAAVCDRVTVLTEGRVAHTGSVAELTRSAPGGEHRMSTSDDDAAVAIGSRHGVVITQREREGFTVTGDQDTLRAFVCDLGRSAVAVEHYVRSVDPLAAVFLSLTNPGKELDSGAHKVTPVGTAAEPR